MGRGYLVSQQIYARKLLKLFKTMFLKVSLDQSKPDGTCIFLSTILDITMQFKESQSITSLSWTSEISNTCHCIWNRYYNVRLYS